MVVLRNPWVRPFLYLRADVSERHSALPHLLESTLKRDLVKQFITDGGWARRIEDRYAVGIPDCLFVGPKVALFAEVKILRSLKMLPTSDAQRVNIERINAQRNPNFRALVIGHRDGKLGFGLPGDLWDAHFQLNWPAQGGLPTVFRDAADAVFRKGPS